MENVKYSKRFMEASNIYIIDDIVIKDRNNVSFERVPMEIVNKNEVLIQQENYIYCFVSEKKKQQINNIVLELKKIGLDCSKYIIFR